MSVGGNMIDYCGAGWVRLIRLFLAHILYFDISLILCNISNVLKLMALTTRTVCDDDVTQASLLRPGPMNNTARN